MTLKKSNLGNKLIKQTDDNHCVEKITGDLPECQLEYITGLVKRLRNLFLSIIPADYCCVMLFGIDDKTVDKDPKLGLINCPLVHNGNEIGLIRYHAHNTISVDDEVKIRMLADLFSYLLYFNLLMLEQCKTEEK